RQTIELARVAVCDEDMDASGHRAVDDRAEAAAIEGVIAVEGRDEDAGDASQGGLESGRLAHGNNSRWERPCRCGRAGWGEVAGRYVSARLGAQSSAGDGGVAGAR